jgi:hypothetical protein
MDLINHRKGGTGMVFFYQVFLLSPLQCTVETVRGCESFKNLNSQGKVEEVKDFLSYWRHTVKHTCTEDSTLPATVQNVL